MVLAAVVLAAVVLAAVVLAAVVLAAVVLAAVRSWAALAAVVPGVTHWVLASMAGLCLQVGVLVAVPARLLPCLAGVPWILADPKCAAAAPAALPCCVLVAAAALPAEFAALLAEASSSHVNRGKRADPTSVGFRTAANQGALQVAVGQRVRVLWTKSLTTQGQLTRVLLSPFSAPWRVDMHGEPP